MERGLGLGNGKGLRAGSGRVAQPQGSAGSRPTLRGGGGRMAQPLRVGGLSTTTHTTRPGETVSDTPTEPNGAAAAAHRAG